MMSKLTKKFKKIKTHYKLVIMKSIHKLKNFFNNYFYVISPDCLTRVYVNTLLIIFLSFMIWFIPIFICFDVKFTNFMH